jgi:hypothetical protein
MPALPPQRGDRAARDERHRRSRRQSAAPGGEMAAQRGARGDLRNRGRFRVAQLPIPGCGARARSKPRSKSVVWFIASAR